MLFKVIIIEDSETAANKLNSFLGEFLDIRVVGIFDNIESAKPLLETAQVDGVFLDIQFNPLDDTNTDGLKLTQYISWLEASPWIIFVTGHPEYAPDAINIAAPNILYGYLLKPYTKSELNEVLNKVRRSALHSSPTSRIEIKYKETRSVKGHPERISITKMLDISDIIYINQDLNVNVHLNNGDVLKDVNITLKKWEQTLLEGNIQCFQKIHRQTIVNLNFANGIKPDSERIDGYLALFKESNDQLPIGGRHFLNAFKEAIKKGKRVPPKFDELK